MHTCTCVHACSWLLSLAFFTRSDMHACTCVHACTYSTFRLLFLRLLLGHQCDVFSCDFLAPRLSNVLTILSLINNTLIFIRNTCPPKYASMIRSVLRKGSLCSHQVVVPSHLFMKCPRNATVSIRKFDERHHWCVYWIQWLNIWVVRISYRNPYAILSLIERSALNHMTSNGCELEVSNTQWKDDKEQKIYGMHARDLALSWTQIGNNNIRIYLGNNSFSLKSSFRQIIQSWWSPDNL